MGLYRRSNFVFNTFRNVGSKLISKTPTQSNCSSSSLYNTCKFSGISRAPSISSRFGYFNVLKQNKSSFLGSGVSRRYYCEIILPPTHPYSVRASLIGKNIIDALQVSSDSYYTMNEKPKNETLKSEVLVNDKRGKENRTQEENKWAKPSIHHLKGLNWDIVVVDKPSLVHAFFQYKCKIVIYSGLLNVFRTDHEIATIIGHEVAHAVARHPHEMATKKVWYVIIQIVSFVFIMPQNLSAVILALGVYVAVYAMYNLLVELPSLRKAEIEADYIGMMLMASAGYDPRVAPNVYLRLEKISSGRDTILKDILETHPRGTKRAQLLSGAMEEALEIYHQVSADRSVKKVQRG